MLSWLEPQRLRSTQCVAHSRAISSESLTRLMSESLTHYPLCFARYTQKKTGQKQAREGQTRKSESRKAQVTRTRARTGAERRTRQRQSAKKKNPPKKYMEGLPVRERCVPGDMLKEFSSRKLLRCARAHGDSFGWHNVLRVNH